MKKCQLCQDTGIISMVNPTKSVCTCGCVCTKGSEFIRVFNQPRWTGYKNQTVGDQNYELHFSHTPSQIAQSDWQEK